MSHSHVSTLMGRNHVNAQIKRIVFFALRTSALWDRNRVIFVIVLLAYTPGLALNYVHVLLSPTVSYFTNLIGL